MTATQILAGVEGVFGHAGWHPNPVGLILLQLSVHLVGFSGGQLSAKDVLGNGVCTFGWVQGS